MSAPSRLRLTRCAVPNVPAPWSHSWSNTDFDGENTVRIFVFRIGGISSTQQATKEPPVSFSDFRETAGQVRKTQKTGMLLTILVGGVVFAGATDSHHMSLLTQCINGMVLESQLPHKIANLLFQFTD